MTNDLSSIPAQPRAENAAWKAIVAEYQKPSLGRALWQITNTVVPYGALWYLMYLCLPVSWWLVVPLAILAGGFLVRVFIIFHDCGHGSYFKSPKANDLVGFLAGILTFTPYYHWRWEHAIHHSSAGDLDKRGTGDVWTMTVQEYLEASRWKKFAYRLARNPFVLFVIAPVFLFLIRQRLPSSKSSWSPAARACGCFTSSISLKTSIGSAAKTGATSRRPCRAAPFTSCRASCNGFPATSAFITSII